jgi:hypothetical protein
LRDSGHQGFELLELLLELLPLELLFEELDSLLLDELLLDDVLELLELLLLEDVLVVVVVVPSLDSVVVVVVVLDEFWFVVLSLASPSSEPLSLVSSSLSFSLALLSFWLSRFSLTLPLSKFSFEKFSLAKLSLESLSSAADAEGVSARCCCAGTPKAVTTSTTLAARAVSFCLIVVPVRPRPIRGVVGSSGLVHVAAGRGAQIRERAERRRTGHGAQYESFLPVCGTSV